MQWKGHYNNVNCAAFGTPQVQGQTGIGALALRLNHILVEHIRALLPSLRAHLEEALERRQRELKKYGAMPPGSTSAARSVHEAGNSGCSVIAICSHVGSIGIIELFSHQWGEGSVTTARCQALAADECVSICRVTHSSHSCA
jgi:hypothetical protein